MSDLKKPLSEPTAPPPYAPYDANAPVVSNQPMPNPMPAPMQNPMPQFQPMAPTQLMAHPSTLIIQQPPHQPVFRDWNTGLCDCTDDVPTCLLGWCCGLCLACQVSQDMGESVCVPCCVPLPITMLRTKWRTQQNIQGSIMEDCLTDAFCGACALCQLAREVKTAKKHGILM